MLLLGQLICLHRQLQTAAACLMLEDVLSEGQGGFLGNLHNVNVGNTAWFQEIDLSPSASPSLSLSLALFLSPSPSFPLSLCLCLSLSLSVSLFLSLSLSLSLSSLSVSLSLSLSLCPSLSLSLPLSLSLYIYIYIFLSLPSFLISYYHRCSCYFVHRKEKKPLWIHAIKTTLWSNNSAYTSSKTVVDHLWFPFPKLLQ